MTLARPICCSLVAVLVAGCAGPAALTNPEPVASVTARAETVAVGTANADAADDPAIWRNPADPAASLIVATDKKAGLHVYDLSGRDRHFVDAGQVNNVDLIETPHGVLVVASDRNDLANAKLALFRLDTAAARLIPLGTIAAGSGEAYGVCVARIADETHVFLIVKDGTIRQIALDPPSTTPSGRIVRTMKLATQSEGCVVDPRSMRLYVGEEDVGVWRFDAAADGAVEGVSIARVDGRRLVADVEGVSILGDHLVVSSQGDNAFAVYRLADEGYVGRFRIGAGSVGSVEETDGIALAAGGFGPGYPDGLLVAQDGVNPPNAQNFKLVSWADVRGVLGL